jgi:hypothetical protein
MQRPFVTTNQASAGRRGIAASISSRYLPSFASMTLYLLRFILIILVIILYQYSLIVQGQFCVQNEPVSESNCGQFPSSRQKASGIHHTPMGSFQARDHKALCNSKPRGCDRDYEATILVLGNVRPCLVKRMRQRF